VRYLEEGQGRTVDLVHWKADKMREYQSPEIVELGSIADFTRGDTFAWQLDGMTFAELLHNALNGDLLGTS
jgi:hypothetical protein